MNKDTKVAFKSLENLTVTGTRKGHEAHMIAQSVLVLAQVIDDGLSGIDSAIMELRDTIRQRS